MDIDLITLGLKLAFRQPGCPICRLQQETESRYLFHLLYENVNDGSTRLHLVRSLGFCPSHAWALQAIEQEKWNDGLGTAILYEDLTGRVLRTLSDYLVRTRPGHGSAARRGWSSLRRWLDRQGKWGHRLASMVFAPTPANALLARLSPSGHCPVCEMVARSEETRLTWLVQKASPPEFPAWYAASDSLCLPHLRRALDLAEDGDAVRFLVEVAVRRLGGLLEDLGEYERKHNWSYRHEPKHPWEQVSWVRVVAFFAGEAPQGVEVDVGRLRQQALGVYRARPGAAPAAG